MTARVEVPPVVRNKAIDAGSAGWLDDLPDLVADLERAWSITVGSTFADSTEAYVAEATLRDGTPTVLKLVVPRAGDHARNEIEVLRHARGDGCVELLQADAAIGAMLLERLGPSLFELGVPIRVRLEILCDTAQRLWRPAIGAEVPTGASKARWLADHITTSFAHLVRARLHQTAHHRGTLDHTVSANGADAVEIGIVGQSSIARARSVPSISRSRVPNGASAPTTTHGPFSSMVTCTSGTRSKQATAGSSSSTLMASRRNPSTTSEPSCGRTRSS